jgi:phosphohistidine swiveling domain-containing protein
MTYTKGKREENQIRPTATVRKDSMQIFLGDQSVSEKSLELMGPKARNLHQLKLRGFTVPPGFVLFDKCSDLNEAISRLGGLPVAVRSSGSMEDLPNASFAGLYETMLFIRSCSELHDAIKKCFESKQSARVRDYLETKKISYKPDDLTMSVLVQKMVEAKVAGVIFTLNPTNGREEEFYIEYCQGVGERLVSGHVTPTTVTYNWPEDKILNHTINTEGTTISDVALQELCHLAARIQAFYGKPQDIEWAIGEDDKIYILQSRPVTTFTPRDDRPELTNADFKDGGVSARVCTPFMYSVYREAVKNSMGYYFKKIHLIPNDEKIQWIHYHYGRVYWNAEAVKEGLKKIPGFREDTFDRDLGLQKEYGEGGPYVTPLTVSTLVGAIPILIGLHREFDDCRTMIRLFRGQFEIQDTHLKSVLPLLKHMTDAEFNHWMLSVILFQNDTEKKYFRTIYNNSNFQSEYKSYLKKLVSYEEGDEIDLMGELHGVAHLDVQAGLGLLKKAADLHGHHSQVYKNEREIFLKFHYHHGPAELDLTVPRWGENTEWVDDLTKNFLPQTKARGGNFNKTLSRIQSRLSFIKKKKFLKFTKESREYLRLREEMRSYSTRAYYLLRRAILEFARRQKMDEMDAFMLDVHEIKRKIIRPESLLPDTNRRRLYYDGYRGFTPPNDFGGTLTTLKVVSSGGLKGLGCSPGELIGRARVILDIHATGDLTKEDILVTLFTDPGWTPVLARVGGVVTEVGGLLSHAAVIGREYGIPAILNLIDATKIIKDGDLIRINGKTGEVEILEKGP